MNDGDQANKYNSTRTRTRTRSRLDARKSQEKRRVISNLSLWVGICKLEQERRDGSCKHIRTQHKQHIYMYSTDSNDLQINALADITVEK